MKVIVPGDRCPHYRGRSRRYNRFAPPKLKAGSFVPEHLPVLSPDWRRSPRENQWKTVQIETSPLNYLNCFLSSLNFAPIKCSFGRSPETFDRVEVREIGRPLRKNVTDFKKSVQSGCTRVATCTILNKMPLPLAESFVGHLQKSARFQSLNFDN
jgi:hypothetical protein